MARQLKHETRILLLTLMSGAPGLALAGWLLWQADFSNFTRWTLGVLAALAWWGFACLLRERVVRPLQTAANLLSALREKDFSVRARSPRRDDALGELMLEINALSQTLREQRLGALEASALLRSVMFEIEVAVFAFDEAHGLKLVNRAGEYLSAAVLLDTAKVGELGGTGETFDWEIAREAAAKLPFLLAGGLNPENVAAAVGRVRPWAVDVSSGVETGGVKDIEKIRAFIRAVKEADHD